MTNFEKYKAAEERAKAFYDLYCSKEDKEDCCYKGVEFCIGCQMRWLDLEAEEEQPLPCPFCGRSTGLAKVCDDDGMFAIRCVCGYHTNYHPKNFIVAAHNRVARAVEKAKEANAYTELVNQAMVTANRLRSDGATIKDCELARLLVRMANAIQGVADDGSVSKETEAGDE